MRGGLTVPIAQGVFTGVAFGPNGATLATAAEPSGVTIWDTETGDDVRTLVGSVRARATTVVLSPDGRRLAAASDVMPAQEVWDIDSGELLLTLEGHLVGSRSIAFSADGADLVSGSRDGCIRVWDAVTGRPTARWPAAGSRGPAT
jgi:WD40 repeat protein